MLQLFPFLQWLPKYGKNWFSKDLVAGLTVGIILVPQGMAYAMIAGLPPVYGLYASLFPVLVYAFLGTSRQLAVGPVAMDSLLVAAGLGSLAISGPENYIAMALFLAFFVGVIQFILGFFRMGFLVNFLSRPVISGFTSAVALIIIFSQLKHLLGTSIEKSNKLHEIIGNTIQKLPEVNLLDLVLSLAGILLIIFLKKWNKKIPAILIVVVLSILSVYFLQLESYDVKIIGVIPTGLPNLQVPPINLKNIMDAWPIALTLALVGYLEAISIGKAIEEKNGEDNINANQELVALGASNMVGSFFQSFPVTASFSRSAINNETGAKTTISSLFSVVVIIVTLLFLTPLFYYLPNAILASIIMVSVYALIDVSYPKGLWKNRKDEFVILLITFLVTLFMGISEGVLIGVLLSLLLMVYKSSKPHFAVLGKIKDSDYYKNVERFEEEVEVREDLLVVRFDSQLYFGNKNYFKNQLFRHIDEKGSRLKGIVLNAEAINDIDSSAAQMLIKVITEIHNRNIKFYITGAIGPTRDIIFSSGIINVLEKNYLFVQTKEAVDYFDNTTIPSQLSERVAYENRTNGN